VAPRPSLLVALSLGALLTPAAAGAQPPGARPAAGAGAPAAPGDGRSAYEFEDDLGVFSGATCPVVVAPRKPRPAPRRPRLTLVPELIKGVESL
jgi:hypothetical protein